MDNKILMFISIVTISSFLTTPSFASLKTEKMKYELVQSLKEENYTVALKLIKDLRKNKVSLGTEIIYFEAKSNLMTGNAKVGEKLLRKYIAVAKGKGTNYQRAIGMIIDIDNNRAGKIKAEKKAKAETISRKKSIAEEKSRVFGKILSINTEWGYAVAQVKANLNPKGKQVFSRINEFKTVSFKLGSSKGDGKYSLTSDELTKAKVGDVLYFN